MSGKGRLCRLGVPNLIRLEMLGRYCCGSGDCNSFRFNEPGFLPSECLLRCSVLALLSGTFWQTTTLNDSTNGRSYDNESLYSHDVACGFFHPRILRLCVLRCRPRMCLCYHLCHWLLQLGSLKLRNRVGWRYDSQRPVWVLFSYIYVSDQDSDMHRRAPGLLWNKVGLPTLHEL